MDIFNHKYLWKTYWKMRESHLGNPIGKQRAALLICDLINRLSSDIIKKTRLIELGCGEGHILNFIAENSKGLLAQNICGLDKNEEILKSAEKRYPNFSYYQRDMRDKDWQKDLGSFNIVFFVNSLHEVFSSFRSQNGEIDTETGKEEVKKIIKCAIDIASQNGYLILFDGIESRGRLEEEIEIKMQGEWSRNLLKKFAKEYQAYKIKISDGSQENYVVLSRRDFTRFITKLRFLDSNLWQIEKEESYQYFNEEEYENVFSANGLELIHQELFISDIKPWLEVIDIKYQSFLPFEHILLAGIKSKKLFFC